MVIIIIVNVVVKNRITFKFIMQQLGAQLAQLLQTLPKPKPTLSRPSTTTTTTPAPAPAATSNQPGD